METAVCVSGFLLLVFSTGAQLSPVPKLLFGIVGGRARFETWWMTSSHYLKLYRISADRDLLLANCSGKQQPDGPKPDGYEVKCVYHRHYFEMSNLTMSQTGDYRTESWIGLSIIGHIIFHLIVCAEGNEAVETVYDDDVAVVCRMDSTLGNSNSLKVHRYHWEYKTHTLVLDTKSSLEPLVEDLRGRLQVDLSTSQVTLSGVTRLDYHFSCTVWREAQCQSYRGKSLSVGDKSVFAHAGDNKTLPCISLGQWDVEGYEKRWDTPTGRQRFNMTDQQEVMYRNQTGNYSLFIPSMSQQHSGMYECQMIWKNGISIGTIQTFYLYVCPLVSPLDVMFSQGESVRLIYAPHLNFSTVDGIMWFCQRVLEPRVLILDSRKGSVSLPEDLKGRVSLRGQMTWSGRETWRGKLTPGERLTNSPLILSNLTAEDSGLYTWRVYEKIEVESESDKYVCFEGIIHLVYRDLFGVHSPFYRTYAPLIGCGLLGLVATLVWFRVGKQTSGCQSREGLWSGDEDLHEGVEMTELRG